MKIRLTTWALLTGIVIIVGPALLGFSPSWIWYVLALIGIVLISIAGYDAKAEMLGLGCPGEELIVSFFDHLKKLKWW
jgi:hypothetical protein